MKANQSDTLIEAGNSLERDIIHANSGPIFVLGTSRSGTTAMSSALGTATGYRLTGEGHVWPLLPLLEAFSQRYFNGILAELTDPSVLDLPEFMVQLRSALPEVFERFYRPFGGKWIDKTPGPEMIDAAPRLLSLYPSAKFVLMRRHPIDSTKSKLRKFGGIGLLAAARDWNNCYMRWLTIRDQLNGACAEVEFFDLFRAPSHIGHAIAGLLGRDNEFADHIGDYLSQNRSAEQTEIKAGASRLTLAEQDWTDDIRNSFLGICGETAAKLGYDLNADYVVDYSPGSISLFLPRLNTSRSFVHHGNDFCYPISGGFQLCANSHDSEPVTIGYRDVPIGKHNRLRFSVTREFLHGPDLILKISARPVGAPIEPTTLRLIAIETVTPKVVDIALPNVPSIDVDIALSVGSDQTSAFGTLRVYNPALVISDSAAPTGS